LSTEETFPLDPAQDRTWSAPRLIIVGMVTLLLALATIYASASLLGEHPNQFSDLDHVRVGG
jgi:hypothetical protein